jgi:hypothetical protein
MEDHIKLLKVEYLSNHWLYVPQRLSWRIGDQTKHNKLFHWRQPQKEDDLQILKVEYLSNKWSDLPQILNLHNHTNQNKFISCNEDNLSKILNSYLLFYLCIKTFLH